MISPTIFLNLINLNSEPMPEPDLNVFEHQRFLLRRPDGSRLRKSFREIMTEGDAAYSLDYPQEFFNVAALSLMAFLAQAAFEPDSVSELAERLREPLTETEFEAHVAPLRPHFRLTGDGPRFMQGPPQPGSNKKTNARPISSLLWHVPSAPTLPTQINKQFLGRPIQGWAVEVEQAALLCFFFNTFFPGYLGGHKQGVNGFTPVRTFVIVPMPDVNSTHAQSLGNLFNLRASIWANILALNVQQTFYEGDYPDSNDTGVYADWFWVKPPTTDVATGRISMLSALGWMSAFAWLQFEESASPSISAVTGEAIPERRLLARELVRTSTKIGYGTSGDRFFRHPNVPVRRKYDPKTGAILAEYPYEVARIEGLVNALGAAFFGSGTKQESGPYALAPVVSQIRMASLRRTVPNPQLWVFGFHMLGDRNVHGGFEMDSFRLPLLEAETDHEARQYAKIAQAWMKAAADTAAEVARSLQHSVQTAAGVGVKATWDNGDVRIKNVEMKSSSDYDFGRDVLTAYWKDVQRAHADHAMVIAKEAGNGSAEATERVQTNWHEQLRRIAWQHFRPVFDYYHTLPRTMPLAFSAQAHLAHNLNTYAPLPEAAESTSNPSNQSDFSR